MAIFLFFALWLSALALIGFEHWKPKEPRDYRVVHFTLRLALVFGIGAVTLAIILTLALIQLVPAFR